MKNNALERLCKYNSRNGYLWHHMENRDDDPMCSLCDKRAVFAKSVSYEGYCLICDSCIDAIAKIMGEPCVVNDVRAGIKKLGKEILMADNKELGERHEEVEVDGY